MTFLILLGVFHVLCGGIVAWVACAPRNRTELLLIAGLFAYVTFFMVPVAVGWLTGVMNGVVLAAGGVAALVCAGLSLWLRGWPSGDFVGQYAPLFRGRSWFEWVIWGMSAVLLLFLMLIGLTLPARSYDAVSYHMSNPIRWHMTGKFILDSFGEASLAPQRASAESAPNVKAVWPFAVMLFTKEMRGTAAAQLPFFLLALVCVRAIGLRLGARPWCASLAVLATMAVPEIIFQATELYSDLMFLSGQLVSVWALLYLWREGFGWRSVLYPIFGFGLLAGAKVSFLTTGAGLGALYGVLLLWRGGRSVSWRVLGYVGVALLLTILMVGAAVAPWFMHSWKKYENPVYPFRVTVGEREIFKGEYDSDINSTMLVQFTGVKGAEAYWNMLKEVGRPPVFSAWSGGLGMGMFVVGIPSLLLFSLAMFFRREALAERILFAVCFGMFMLTCAALGVSRFSLFQSVMGFIAFGWLISSFVVVLREIAVLVMLSTISYDVFMTVAAIQYRQLPPALVAFNLLSGHYRAAQLAVYPDQYTALDYWREEISEPGLKLILPPADVSVPVAYEPRSPGDLLRYRNPRSIRELDSWHGELVAAGGTHLYVRRGKRYDLAWVLERPDLFEPLMRRLDFQFGVINGGFVLEPWPEDALFAIKQKPVL